MFNDYNEDAVIKNLEDAGCDNSTISAIVADINEGKVDEGLKLLSTHRRALLDDIHKKQKRIDCLDYLVFKLEKDVKKR